MKKISVLNRFIFLFTGHVAGYKVVGGIQPYSELTTFYYTVAFGTLVLASILLMLFGFEILESNGVLVVAAFIPVSLSLGMVNQYLPQMHLYFLIISIAGIGAVAFSRFLVSEKTAVLVLTLVHGIAGSVVVLIPLMLVINGTLNTIALLISLGGIIIGSEGLLLAAFKMGKEFVAAEKIYASFPVILFMASLAFIVGMQN